MPHYILVCDKGTILPSLKESRWGVKEKNISKLNLLSIEDTIFIYIKGQSPLGKGAICGPFYVSQTSHNPDGGFYQEKNYSKIIEFSQESNVSYIEFKDTVQEISLVKNKEHWGMIFMGRAIIAINQEDSDSISSRIREKGYPVRS